MVPEKSQCPLPGDGERHSLARNLDEHRRRLLLAGFPSQPELPNRLVLICRLRAVYPNSYKEPSEEESQQ
jgi:hypothetical protein